MLSITRLFTQSKLYRILTTHINLVKNYLAKISIYDQANWTQ